jgi:hypothetical protein
MNSSIKSFSEFRNQSLNNVNEDWSDYLGNVFSSAAGGLSDVIKGKVTNYLLEFFGINEQSIFSKLVQNFVEQFPVSDLFSIIFSGKTNASYLAPKAADATIEFLQEKGLDGIAKDLKIDPNGWIYRTISEMLSNQTKREDFRKGLEGFYLEAFNGFESINQDEFTASLSPTERSKMTSSLEASARRQGQTISGGNQTNSNEPSILDRFLGTVANSSQQGASQGTTTGSILGNIR